MTRKEIYDKLRETFHSKSGCFLSKESCNELAHQVSNYATTDRLLNSKNNKEKLLESIKEVDVKTVKPPIGIKPTSIFLNERLDEIKGATIRFLEHGKPIPAWWIKEYNDIIEIFNKK